IQTEKKLYCFGKKGRSPGLAAAPKAEEWTAPGEKKKLQVVPYEVLLNPGQYVSAGSGEPPAVKVLVKPTDAVQWALYYPPLAEPGADVQPDQVCNQTSGNDAARCLTLRAEQRMRVGRVEEARSDIAQSLRFAPDNAEAIALLSVISVVKNDTGEALHLARRATTLDASSARAWISLSYAQQANLKLDDALASAVRAAELDAKSSTAKSRVAELLMSLGRTRAAEPAALAAVEINPQDSRARSVLGFVHLAQIDINKARADFQAAIERDSSDPLPRLGLGLAIIRDGDLPAGREQIEIAVALDPTNSLIRSYMGKAYYEENSKARDKLAGTQLELAKRLDPNDPTPWFYDAIKKQTDNRSGEALIDLEESVKRNQNRAVYRSQLLLDQDLSARSASLARIYDSLGFDQLGLSEGMSSLAVDPGNFSAHRFLVGAYSDTPRYEIARVSELLQSQLLQPLSLTPVPPQLAEADFGALAGAGPGAVSFNEFNPLFVRDNIGLQASGVFGSDKTRGDEVIVSGLSGPVSYSLGQFHYQTDGFRANDDFSRDIYDAFAQIALSPWSAFQAEVRTAKTRTGDITQRIDPDNFSPNFRRDIDSEVYRLGYRYSFSSASHLLFSLIRQRRDESQIDRSTQRFPAFTITESRVDRVDSATTAPEVRWSFTAPHYTLDLGGGYYNESLHDLSRTSRAGRLIFPPIPFPVTPTIVDNTGTVLHTTTYGYWSFDLLGKLRATVGLSHDNASQSTPLLGREQTNPKLGLVWKPTDATTLRAAGFRVLKRNLGANQTIEPTAVAGFNQLFDDVNATDAQTYGLGIDQRFSTHWFGGGEITRRHLDIPVLQTRSNTFGPQQQRETHERVYLYWLATPRISVSAEYFYERLDRTPTPATISTNPRQVATNRFPLGIQYHHANGLFATLQTSYVDQRVGFPAAAAGLTNEGSRFWITDAALGYRLPQRRGIVSFEIKNLFDRRFGYQDADLNGEPKLPLFSPDRLFLLKLYLTL
ncbi:MAG: TonB-dependent receptor, partial [Nitrospirota bacterium]